MFKHCYILIVYLLSGLILQAQSVNQKVQDVVMPAPNAAALGKYGDIPVSYFTGVPSISVPITTVQDGPLSLPVSLSYHASGIKVGEMASWVGMGWSMNAAGMITRTIQGLPDEISPAGYYYTGKSLSINTSSGGANQTTLTELATGARDGEPDLFSFTTADLSGKFYLDKDNKVQLVPQQDLRVELLGGSAFEGFIITKADGVRYIFGKIPGTSTTAREETTIFSEGVPNTTSWYLLRIETPDKLYGINFVYASESYAYKSLATCKRQATQCSTGNGTSGGGSYICSTETGYDEAHHYLTAQVSSKRLSQITVGTGTTVVTFGASTDRTDLDANNSNGGRAKRLDYIQVSSGASDAYCTKFELSYDYFHDNSSTAIAARSESRRLKLNQVQEKACNGEVQYTKPPTKFTYNGTPSSGAHFLPHRLSKAIDHWGFYNGQNQNNAARINVPSSVMTIPGRAAVEHTSDVNRETSETEMKKGVLERIDYPTGGSTQFVYEANTYNREVDGAPVYKKLNGTQQALQTAVAPYEEINCGEHTFISTSPHVTFATATELSISYFKLYLANAFQTTCESNPDRVVKVSIIQVSTNLQVGNSFSFNTSNYGAGQTSGNITKKLSDLSANLQPGVAYKFVLYARDGWGKLEVFSTPRVMQVAKAGGLRVRSITTSDGISSSNNMVRTYEYRVSSTSSSGKLLYTPRYAYSASGIALVVDRAPYTYGGEVDAIFFDENSLVPLSSFEGYHIGYSTVKELYNGNGYTVYDYIVADDPIGNNNVTYPRPPHQLDVTRGTVSKETRFAQSTSTAVASTTYSPASANYINSPGSIIRLSAGFQCVSAFDQSGQQPSGSRAYFHTPYFIRSGAYRLSAKTEILDGVSTTTSYTYGTIGLAPKTVTVTNSNTAQTVTTYNYAYDLPTGAVRTALLDNRYMIGIPLETKVAVSGRLVSGSRTDYSLFSRATGLPVMSGTDVEVYPHKFYDHEMTWNSLGTATTATAVLKGTIDSYHPATATTGRGYPKQYTAANWPAETYEWQNGMIKKRTYKDYVWAYTYHSGTRLLSSITDIDGQITSYTYDKLGRLRTTSARAGKVVTTFDYHYTGSTISANKNYVKTSTTYAATAGSSLTNRTSIQYLDGLGRPLQTVEQKYAPSGKDVVTAVQYDNQGRVSRTYNPFEATTTTGIYTAIPSTAKYTLTGYEASPLGRISSVTPPDWYATTTTYGANSQSDDVLKQHSSSTEYDGSLLYKQTVTDPQGNQTITFTDKKGRVVLTRRKASGSSTVADTYQYYDDKDRVIEVIPPGATRFSADLNFKYTYDGANNMLTKKVPDAALVTYKYSNRDQPVLMQDGNLLAASKWMATQYDDYGRVTKTGYWAGTVPTTITPSTITISSANELTKSYYDGYDGSTQLTLSSNPQYRGKVRKSMAKVLDGGSTWLSTVNTYDAHGRLTATVGNNYQYASGTSAESTTSVYDWADNLMSQMRVHKPSSSVTRTLAYRNTYDAAGRRDNYYLKVDAGTEVKLANYTYNERDLLKERNLGATGSTYLQSLDYAYNAQGWLAMINQSNLGGTSVGIKVGTTAAAAPNPGTPSTTVDANDLFYLELRYDQLLSGLSGTVRKDGNIAQVISRVRGRERQAYSATYDYLGRMQVASYYDISDVSEVSSDQKFREEVTYADARGNLGTLRRNGLYLSGASWTVGQIDNLTYSYTSGTNRLATVTDAAPVTAAKALGFKAGSGAGYTYDANGNLKTDSYKGLTATDYNLLNLPSKFTLGSKTVTITYDATGRKLKKVTAGGTTAENYTQWYADGLEYRSTTLEAIYHEEGRVTPKGSGWQYEYSIKDHLGNTRLTFADKNGDGKIAITASASTNEVLQENHYYPFGLQQSYAWMNDGALADTKYQFNGIERGGDFGLGLDLADFRSYDPAIGRWGQVDELAEFAPDMPPYRFGFNAPLRYSDPFGLFESEEAARAHASDNGIRTGFFSSNKIREQSDGSWAIENNREHTSTQDLGGELGVLTSVMVKPNDVVSQQNGGNIIDGYTQETVFRGNGLISDGIHWNTTAQGGTVPVTGGGGKIPNFVRGVYRIVKMRGGSGSKLSKPFHKSGRGRTFKNLEEKLPKTDANGNLVKYTEYDVKIDPAIRGTGGNRGGHRLVTGSDGSAWYTTNHYNTFRRVE